MYKNPEKCLKTIEKWWEENKPETNAEWVKKKLEEIGYKVNINRIKEFCPPHKDSYFGEPECRDILDCNDCFKWWDEYHVGD